MITNQFISPHPLLKPFVSSYILSTSHGLNTTFSSHWAASNEISLIFYLDNQPEHKNNPGDANLSGKRNGFIGLSTRYNGVLDFKGRYHTFIIQFELSGINRLFGMPMVQFTDKIYAAADVFGKRTDELHDQLANAVTIQQTALFADAFLLPFLNRASKRFPEKDCTPMVSKSFDATSNLLSVSDCARHADMSIKTFERKFAEQSGVLPKLYMKLQRFNEAVKMKAMHPSKSFTSIAHECGYFDQMHFIKEFKQFTGLSPRTFFTQNKALSRHFKTEELVLVHQTASEAGWSRFLAGIHYDGTVVVSEKVGKDVGRLVNKLEEGGFTK